MTALFILKPVGWGMRYGVGTYLKQYTNSLLKHDDIHIFIVNYFSDKYKEVTINSTFERLTEIFIPKPQIKGFRNDADNQKYADRIVDFLTPIIQSYANHVIQTNYTDALPIVKTLKSRFNSKVISVIHLSQWQYEFNGNINKYNEIFGYTRGTNGTKISSIEMEKELLKLSDKIITVTYYMKTFISSHYEISEEKITVIYNGIDNSSIKVIGQKEKLTSKQDFGFEKDEKIVLFVGRLEKNKGLIFLLDAFNDVVKRYKKVRLVLAGDDPGPDKISKFIPKYRSIWGKVTFTGFIESGELEKLYQVADIGIVPSIYDQCPYVVLEMMGHNIPLIISNTDGLNEMLSSDQSIYLTQSIDPNGDIVLDNKEISGAILSLLNDEGSIQDKITSDYQNIIRSKFSSIRMANEFYSIISGLTDSLPVR